MQNLLTLRLNALHGLAALSLQGLGLLLRLSGVGKGLIYLGLTLLQNPVDGLEEEALHQQIEHQQVNDSKNQSEIDFKQVNLLPF